MLISADKYNYGCIRENLTNVALSDRVHRNCVRFYNSESDNHIFTKVWICEWLKDNCIDFITECNFKHGCRADIYLLQKNEIIEILNTEKEKNIELKEAKYGRTIHYIICNKVETKTDVIAWCDDELKT